MFAQSKWVPGKPFVEPRSMIAAWTQGLGCKLPRHLDSEGILGQSWFVRLQTIPAIKQIIVCDSCLSPYCKYPLFVRYDVNLADKGGV